MARRARDRGGMARAVAAAGGALATMVPDPALACAICFSGAEDTLVAFYTTALLLTLLPFALIGGIGFWFYRRTKARDPGPVKTGR